MLGPDGSVARALVVVVHSHVALGRLEIPLEAESGSFLLRGVVLRDLRLECTVR